MLTVPYLEASSGRSADWIKAKDWISVMNWSLAQRSASQRLTATSQ
ncbi:hypothetical protein OESDEN_18935 [Oesophagostomum dentatum]|uniref:Uncharacterized protein n=1 Tax=Oesophagostomum dentatum TaxID=61180 RepID=A0A0B1S8V7_OESDE|nr:hypothetical protein OESDEN_18935 [Oesophagostomum dentatum]